ncbi:MAG: hypothetical protein IKT46_02265 [Clostridia bacterium]|nr:hypothetical protein [Clostridia bacterium]
MRWEVSYNTNEKSLQKKVVEAGNSEEAKRKVEVIARAESNSSQFRISFNGVRVV